MPPIPANKSINLNFGFLGGGKGISHSAAVGKRPKLLSEEESKALEDFYIRMICELKESGY